MKNKEEVIKLILSFGFVVDRFGHYQKETGAGRHYRIKIQKTSIRFERKNTFSKQWINIRSDYFKNIIINENSIIIKDILISGNLITKVKS